MTAYGAGSENCKVQNWGPTLADQIVYVRCFDAAGNAVDTQFTAAFTRPIARPPRSRAKISSHRDRVVFVARPQSTIVQCVPSATSRVYVGRRCGSP